MNENVYFECRKRAAIHNERLNSRAGAAEILGISESTLAHYELGITKNIPVDTQEKMEKAKRIRNTRHASMMDGHPMNCAKRLKITRKNWFEREQRVNT